MTILTLACVATGMAVGLRFKVLAILPVIAIAMLLTGAIMIARGDHAWAIAATILVNAAGIQIGYLCMTFAQAILKDARTPEHAIAAEPRATGAYRRRVGVPVEYID